MMFPQLAHFADVALLLLRVMVGIVFITSGWNHLKDPEARSKNIGMRAANLLVSAASRNELYIPRLIW